MDTAVEIVDVHADTSQSGVSWAAIAAGAVAAAALTLVLVALGAGLGLSSISPWGDSGVSASAFEVGSGIYLVVVAVMSSAIGGYLAARLRTKWVGLHSNEVFFRDTAHGFLAWAFATLISATALASTTAYLANGAIAGMGGAAVQSAQSINPAQIYIDKLFRTMPTASRASTADNAAAGGAASPTQNNFNQAPAEVLRLWTADFRDGQDLNSERSNLRGATRGGAHWPEPGRRREARRPSHRRGQSRR